MSFLCRGHTHNENDQTFSVIATYLRNHNDIYCVEDFLKALEAAQKEPCPIDVSRLWGCAPISQYIKKNALLETFEGQSEAQQFKIVR